METAYKDNSFKEFSCKGEQRNGVVSERRFESREIFIVGRY